MTVHNVYCSLSLCHHAWCRLPVFQLVMSSGKKMVHLLHVIKVIQLLYHKNAVQSWTLTCCISKKKLMSMKYWSNRSEIKVKFNYHQKNKLMNESLDFVPYWNTILVSRNVYSNLLIHLNNIFFKKGLHSKHILIVFMSAYNLWIQAWT